MGRQSSRIYLNGKDHKEIYFNGHYHDAMYIGSNLVWEKIQSSIEELSNYEGIDLSKLYLNVTDTHIYFIPTGTYLSDSSGYKIDKETYVIEEFKMSPLEDSNAVLKLLENNKYICESKAEGDKGSKKWYVYDVDSNSLSQIQLSCLKNPFFNEVNWFATGYRGSYFDFFSKPYLGTSACIYGGIIFYPVFSLLDLVGCVSDDEVRLFHPSFYWKLSNSSDINVVLQPGNTLEDMYNKSTKYFYTNFVTSEDGNRLFCSRVFLEQNDFSKIEICEIDLSSDLSTGGDSLIVKEVFATLTDNIDMEYYDYSIYDSMKLQNGIIMYTFDLKYQISSTHQLIRTELVYMININTKEILSMDLGVYREIGSVKDFYYSEQLKTHFLLCNKSKAMLLYSTDGVSWNELNITDEKVNTGRNIKNLVADVGWFDGDYIYIIFKNTERTFVKVNLLDLF